MKKRRKTTLATFGCGNSSVGWWHFGRKFATLGPSKPMEEHDMTLGEKLQTLRRSRGLSQEQLAEILEVSRQAVSKWENGVSHS
jgi:hypothetical protein